MNKRIAKISAEFGFYLFGRFKGSLGPGVLYIACRRMYSRPEIVKAITEEMAKTIKEKNIKADLIAGVETAGLPLAMALSLETGIPFVQVRKEKSERGEGKFIEGLYKKGQTALVIDDSVGDGRTKEVFIKNLWEEGLKVNDVMVIFWTGMPIAPFYKEKGLNLHYLFEHEEFVRYCVENNYLPKRVGEYLYNYFESIERWAKDEKLRQEFFQVVREAGLPLYNMLNNIG